MAAFVTGYAAISFVVAAILASLLLGSVMIFMTFVQDIKQQLKNLNANWESDKNRVELLKNFRKVIQFHGECMQLSHYPLHLNFKIKI